MGVMRTTWRDVSTSTPTDAAARKLFEHLVLMILASGIIAKNTEAAPL